MGARPLEGPGWKLFSCAALLWSMPVVLTAQTIPTSNLDAPKVPVYVSDFELASVSVAPQAPATARPLVGADGKADANPANSATSGNPAPPTGVLLETDTPSARARKLMDFFTLTLVQTLEKNNFTAAHSTGGRPGDGVMVRGVFTEIDPTNHIRKALLGSASTNTQFTLYVAIFNLSRADQPLYQSASVQSPDNRFGPTITPNNYVPMAKYELSKNPTAEDVQKICTQIVNNLSGLIKANPEAFHP